MFSSRTKLQQMPPWTRAWLSSLLFLSILSMHGAISRDDGGLVDHHNAAVVVLSSLESAVAADDSVGQLVDVADLTPQPGGESGLSMSDCGGLAAVCLAMIVGASAYIVLRGRAVDRVLWQLPSQPGMTFGQPSGPFEALSPRERSSVLRR